MKRYKFQALMTLRPADGGQWPELDAAPRRMVLRGMNGRSGRTEFFSVLVSRDDDTPVRARSPRVEVTLRIAGDDIPDYLDVGRQFALWLGEDVADGIVTRRLFV